MSARIVGNHNAHSETGALVWEILISLRDQLVSRAYPLYSSPPLAAGLCHDRWVGTVLEQTDYTIYP